MRYIDKSYVEKNNNIIELYDKTGNIIDADKKYMLTHYAKMVKKPSGSETYFIRIHQSTPFDPNGPYGKREKFIETKIKRTSRNTFDFYMTYLKTNNSIYLTKAQRGFLND
jgi:hypothetical protein